LKADFKGDAVELFSFLLILALVLLAFKLLGIVIKTSIFLISIPLQILFALLLTIVIFLVLPVALVSGMSIFLASLGMLAGFLPFILVVFGIYLLVRK